ncbi:MAG TPA: superoxide dismutase [Edaphocola sp.]|nr:superoxide dismutase [Edaphocola sp.]
MTHTLPELPYSFDALEPHIDAMTMEIHHDRHHKGYVDNLNKAIEGTEAANLSLEDLMANISKFPAGVRNNGGGHYNHSLFWQVLSNNGSKPSEKLAKAIEDFGGMEALKQKVSTAGATRFGSGWAWIIVKDGKLEVTSTPNQDNPLMDVAEVKGAPIFGVDVWEHAYYLKYQNKRPDYLSAVWNVINWDEVSKRYEAAL